MTGVKLENDALSIQINEYGAELSRIYDKRKERDVLWDATPEVWPRHAPILFPFIGNCYEGKYQHEGRVYPMTSHGFARDSVFELVSLSANEVCHRLTDRPETCENYPFQFSLEVIHKLEGSRVTITWKVTNRGDGTMWYMIGGHPAFVVPEGRTVHDFTFRFGEQQELHYEAPDEHGYADSKKENILKLKNGTIALTKGFFDEVLTYIFDRGQVAEVSLLLPGDEPYVTLHCEGIPFLGVWTKESTHPFVCLEPWFGRCADDGFAGELKDRVGVMSLKAGETFQAGYVIEIH